MEDAELQAPLRLLDQLASALEKLPDETLSMEQRTLLISLQVRAQAMWNALVALRDELRGEARGDVNASAADFRTTETLQ